MNELFKQLLAGLKQTSSGTKLIALFVGAALVSILGVAGWIVNRPHYEIAFSGLTDHEVAEVNKALAEAGIAFQVSQPPGPFLVFVDRAERTAAYTAVYGAGALDKPLEGILADGGAAAVFSSAEERAQSVRKREWQEMEKMLEELDFVVAAKVRTSPSSGSPLLGKRASPATASVTLRLAGGAELSAAQATTVANLVSRGLGIEKRQLVISDQTGKSLYDGEERGDESLEVADLLTHQSDYDRRLAREANALLDQILGANKARVSVSSEWDYAQSTLQTETTQKGAVVQETKTSSEKPLGSSGATAVGLSANTLDPDAPEDAQPGAEPASAPLIEKTSEEKKSYAPSTSREQRVRIVPVLERLSVALFLDQSIQKAEQQDLEAAIKAAVGFDDERDAFSSVVLPFVAPLAEPAPATQAVEAPAESNPLLEQVLERGVEIVSALVFLVLLFKSLKGVRKNATERNASVDERNPVDPELLARAQIDELLKSDPGRVGEILSRWAREEPVASNT